MSWHVLDTSPFGAGYDHQTLSANKRHGQGFEVKLIARGKRLIHDGLLQESYAPEMSSKAHRRYAAGVERTLGLFDTKHEWADYISYLRSLHKAIGARPDDIVDIPFKSIISLHLAQCLKPALPSGVHQKALEMYAYIFGIIGTDGLARDLSIYFPGLSSTLSFASLSIRPLFLAIVQDYILPLSVRSLRPALKSIILSLLPGLEEQNSDDFDTTLSIFDVLRQIFRKDATEGAFWQTLFLASITDSTGRMGILAYLVARLPTFAISKIEYQAEGAMPVVDNEAVLRPEPGLLIRCFATGLQDDQILVQRGFLDLLVTHIPLNSPVFNKDVVPADRQLLATAALGVVLRRDMSLNRRLWTWFAGSEEDDGDANLAVVQTHSKSNGHNHLNTAEANLVSPGSDQCIPLLVEAIEEMLRSTTKSPQKRSKPFRIARSLMDRWAIGTPVIVSTFTPMMEALIQYLAASPPSAEFEEVFRSANAFFDSVEAHVIWSQILKLAIEGNWAVVEFVLGRFNLMDEEMRTVHIPLVALFLTYTLRKSLDESKSSVLRARLPAVISLLVNLTAPTIFKTGVNSEPKETNYVFENEASGNSRDQSVSRDIEAIKQYYTMSTYSNDSEPLFSTEAVGVKLRGALADLYLLLAANQADMLEMFPQISTSLLVVMSRSSPETSELQTALKVQLLQGLEANSDLSIAIVISFSRLIKILALSHERNCTIEHSVVSLLVHKLWHFLGFQTIESHVEASQQICELYSVTEYCPIVESVLTSELIPPRGAITIADLAVARFSILLTHSQTLAQTDKIPAMLQPPLLLLVDSQHDNMKGWVQAQQSPSSILETILQRKSDRTVVLSRLVTVLQAFQKPQWVEARSDPSKVASRILSLCFDTLKGTRPSPESYQDTLNILRLFYETGGVPSAWNTADTLSMLVRNVSTQEQSIHYGPMLDTIVAVTGRQSPPSELLMCLLIKLRSIELDGLKKTVQTLCYLLPLTGQSVFEHLIPVTETFCKRLEGDFAIFAGAFTPSPQSLPIVNGNHKIASSSDLYGASSTMALDEGILELLAGLEYLLARAHEVLTDRETSDTAKSPDHDRGLFKSTVSLDQLDTETKQLRSSIASNYLTLNLCFKDCIYVCCSIWFWCSGEVSIATESRSSYRYFSARLRNRSRRILEHFIEAEPQECIELLIELWVTKVKTGEQKIADQIFRLLQTLPGARPRMLIPYVARAVSRRTASTIGDRLQQPTASSGVSLSELGAFVIDYVRNLEDDLLDEIWGSGITLLRDVLLNPMAHRQMLVQMLELISCIGTKMENTNFGEVTKMRRELADLCVRLLTAIFTVKPEGRYLASDLDKQDSNVSEERSIDRLSSADLVTTLCDVLPTFQTAFGDLEHLNTIYTGILQNVLGPSLRSRNYPAALTKDFLRLLGQVVKSQGVAKLWRKDVTDAFNDARFFQTSSLRLRRGWFPILQAVSVSDKQCLPDIILRLPAPTTTGLLFGVGASSARVEADKKAALNLKRLAVLVMANEPDSILSHLESIFLKLEELLAATASSAPSSAVRGDAFILIRSIIISLPSAYLASFWPLVDTELRRTLVELLPSEQREADGVVNSGISSNALARLQAAKLLDVLLLLRPPGFLRHEWLFITDTVDAVYPPAFSTPSAISDRIAEANGETDPTDVDGPNEDKDRSTKHRGLQKPRLCQEASRNYTSDTDVDHRLLAPFFRQLSIHAFEDVYSLEGVDLEATENDLIADIFEIGSS